MPRTTIRTKHFELTQRLRRQFATYRPGQEVPTVRELAQSLGVAQGTISKTLNTLRDEGVIERPAGRMRLVVRELHHHVNRRISVIRPSWPSPDYDAIIRSILMVGQQRDWGFDVMSYDSLRSIDLNRMIGVNDAALLLPSSELFPDHLRVALRCPNKPVVVLHQILDEINTPSVTVDEIVSGREAVAHLADLGHRKILAVMSEPPSGVVQARIEGWRQIMEERELVPEVDPYLVNCKCHPATSSTDNAYAYLSRWIPKSKLDFTAIFFDCWTGALAGLRVLRELKIRVPEDVSVAAFAGAGSIADYMAPPLTATEADTDAIGEAVMAELDSLFDGGEPSGDVRIPPRLVVRESTQSIK